MTKSRADNEEARAEAHEAFAHFDRYYNGFIDRSEFAELTLALAPDMPPEEIEIGWREVDTNQNARIDFREFWRWWTDR